MDDGNLWDSKAQILNYSEEILNFLVYSKLLKSNSNDKNECTMENLQRQVEFYVSKKNFKRNSQFFAIFEILKSSSQLFKGSSKDKSLKNFKRNS